MMDMEPLVPSEPGNSQRSPVRKIAVIGLLLLGLGILGTAGRHAHRQAAQYHTLANVNATLALMGSEPRCSLMNLKTKKKLVANGDWNAEAMQTSPSRWDWFKLQKKEWNGDTGYPTVILIRTDGHPQSLLTYTSMAFEGGTWDRNKCYDEHRWWNPIMLNVHSKGSNPDAVVVALRVDETKYEDNPKYLSSSGDEVSVERIAMETSDPDFPDQAKWVISVIGSAWSPGEVTGAVVVAPLAAGAAAFTGGLAVGALGAGGWSIAGAATLGGVAAGSASEVAALTPKVTKTFFVDW